MIIVRENNAPALFAIFAIIGACSVSLLPIGELPSQLDLYVPNRRPAVELGVELTRNPAGSSAVLRFVANLFSIIFIQCTSLRAFSFRIGY